MPLYEYVCPVDNEKVEIIRPVEDRDKEVLCPDCGTVMKRPFHSTSFTFKGPGFYGGKT